MAQERLPMHRIREVLRLKHVCRLSNRKIALSCGVDRDTVGMYFKRAEKAGLNWPLPETLSDCELEARLFPKRDPKPTAEQRALPDCRYIYEELRSYKKKVSLRLKRFVERRKNLLMFLCQSMSQHLRSYSPQQRKRLFIVEMSIYKSVQVYKLRLRS